MAEKFCECPLPCQCNVPFEGRGARCPDCMRGNHMDKNGVRSRYACMFECGEAFDTEREAILHAAAKHANNA